MTEYKDAVVELIQKGKSSWFWVDTRLTRYKENGPFETCVEAAVRAKIRTGGERCTLVPDPARLDARVPVRPSRIKPIKPRTEEGYMVFDDDGLEAVQKTARQLAEYIL